MNIKEILKKDMSETLSIGTTVYAGVAFLSMYVLSEIVTEQMNSGILMLVVWLFAYIFFLPIYIILFIIYVYITKKEALSFVETVSVGFMASLIIGILLFAVGAF